MSQTNRTKIILMIPIVLLTNIFFSLDTTLGLIIACVLLFIMNRMVDKRLPPVKQPEITNLTAFALAILIAFINTGLSWLGCPRVITFPLTVIGALFFLQVIRPYGFKEPPKS